MSIVEFRNLAKRYGRHTVLDDVTLAVEPGDFLVVYGLPASGKSVLMRLLAGLEPPDAGQIVIRSVDVTHIEPGGRNLGYVPQSFALYPHYSVHENIAYPLKLLNVSQPDIEREVGRVADLLSIGDLLNKRPDQLSGGQKQRVAIARGLVKRTDIFVLDDPLTGLDFKLRERLIDDLRQTQELLNVTFIYTTSDALETLLLARTIAVLDGGRVVETGSPQRLYDRPERARTMELLGFPQTNFMPGTLCARYGSLFCKTALFDFKVELAPGLVVDQGPTLVGVRPEHVLIGSNGVADAQTCTAQVVLREDLGGEEIVYFDANGTALVTLVRHGATDHLPVQAGESVPLAIHPADLVLFAPDNGQRVGKGA